MSQEEEIDFGVPVEDIKGGDPFVTNPGRYLAKINAFAKQDTKSGDKSFINCEFELLDTADTENEVSLGRKVWDIFNFNPEALWKIKSLLKAIYPDFTGQKVPKDITEKFVSMWVYLDKYNGNENFRAKNYQNADEWEGLNFRVADGELISLGDKLPPGEEAEAAKAAAKTKTGPKNGKKKDEAAALPSGGTLEEGEVDI